MKKYYLLTVILLFSFFISCESDKPTSYSEIDTSIPSILYGAELNGRQLPDGTTTRVLNNGSKVELTYPDGIRFISVKTDGTFLILPATCYECTGGCSSGCDVFYIKKKFACNQCDNGATCTGSSVPCESSSNSNEGKSGYVDFNAGVSFVKNGSNINNQLKGPSIDILMQIPEVLSAMKKFNMEIYGTENPDHSKVTGELKKYFVNLFGSIVIYRVPQTYFTSARSANSLFSVPADATCSCQSGSSGCKYDSGIGYEACISGECVKCRMKVD